MSSPRLRSLPAVGTACLLALASCAGPNVRRGGDAPATAKAADATLQLGQSVPQGTSFGLPLAADAAQLWVAAIDTARDRVELEHFYAVDRDGGSRLTPVLDALARAAERGVRVRVLLDAGFAQRYGTLPKALAALPHAEVRTIDGKATFGGIQHAKLLLVDGRRVFVGSQNFDWRAIEHILELGVATDAACVVRPIAALFAMDWALAGGATKDAALALGREVGGQSAAHCDARLLDAAGKSAGATVTVRAVASPTGWLPDADRWDLPELVAEIAAAKRSVRISMLSMHRTERDGSELVALEEALVAAAERGVLVQVLLGQWTRDKPERVREARRLAARHANIDVRLLVVPPAAEGRIPFARVLHAKVLVVDGERAWIGTSNWAHGYFHGSRNAGVLIQGAAVAAPLDAWLQRLWAVDGNDTLDERPDAAPTPAPATSH